MPGIIGSVIIAKEDEIEVNLSSYFARTKYCNHIWSWRTKYFIGPSGKNDRTKYDMTALHCTTHNIMIFLVLHDIFTLCMPFFLLLSVLKLQELINLGSS